MCRELGVAPSGYYAWLQCPQSTRAIEDARLLQLIHASYTASYGIYGAPRVFLDLREAGETCSKHRVERLMREHGLRALHGYRTRRWVVSQPTTLTPNVLKRRFTVTRPNVAWATEIAYVRTWQGWLYLAVVLDLFSRKVVGWAAASIIKRALVLDERRRFCRANHLEPNMSRKGNCWDNAVAAAFFSSLKKERIKKHIYPNREIALADLRDYIEAFYNPIRRHSHLGGVSPEQFEAAHQTARRRSRE